MFSSLQLSHLANVNGFIFISKNVITTNLDRIVDQSPYIYCNGFITSSISLNATKFCRMEDQDELVLVNGLQKSFHLKVTRQKLCVVCTFISPITIRLAMMVNQCPLNLSRWWWWQHQHWSTWQIFMALSLILLAL